MYRRQTAAGAWRWMRLDADAGQRREAFDHDGVAAWLALEGEPVAADRLPLLPLDVVEGALRALVGARAIAIDLETKRVRGAAPGGRGPAATPDREGTSIGGWWGGHGDPVREPHRGAGGARVARPRGRAHVYGRLDAGARRRQHTFPGHVWRAVDAGGAAIGTWRARTRIGVAWIEPRAAVDEPAPPPRSRKQRGTSPDGRWRVFVRDHDVHLEDLERGGVRRLTDDGTAEDPYVGRWSWSPSSTTVMVVREKPAQEHRVQAIDSAPDDRVEPRLRSWSYLKPGDRIAVPRPHLFDVARGARIDVPGTLFDTPWSISHFSWAPEGERFRFLYNQRGHQILRFLELDAQARTVRTIVEEQSDTFVDYSQKTLLERIPDTDAWVWMSERSGTNHLYRLDAQTGAIKPITRGPWVVRRVLDSTAPGAACCSRRWACSRTRIPTTRTSDGSASTVNGLVWLTEGDGTHAVTFSPDGAHCVDTWSRVDLPPVHELRRTARRRARDDLEEADWAQLLAAGWTPAERFVAKGRDGKTDIWGVICPSRPHFDPEQAYPVIEEIYAGPHGHFVPKRFAVWHGGAGDRRSWASSWCRSTGWARTGGSKAFHDVCWKNLGDAGFPDRIAWIQAAAAGATLDGPGARGHLRRLGRRAERPARPARPRRLLPRRPSPTAAATTIAWTRSGGTSRGWAGPSARTTRSSRTSRRRTGCRASCC